MLYFPPVCYNLCVDCKNALRWTLPYLTEYTGLQSLERASSSLSSTSSNTNATAPSSPGGSRLTFEDDDHSLVAAVSSLSSSAQPLHDDIHATEFAERWVAARRKSGCLKRRSMLQQQHENQDSTSSILSECGATSGNAAGCGSRRRGRAWIRISWAAHFCMGFAVLSAGIWNNHGEFKFIPIQPAKVGSSRCQSVYLNVLAPSMDYPGAIVCCDKTGQDTFELRRPPPAAGPDAQPHVEIQHGPHHQHPGHPPLAMENYSAASESLRRLEERSEIMSNQSAAAAAEPVASGRCNICSWIKSNKKFPLASRLSRFPEAWLFPLYPIMILMMYGAFQLVAGKRKQMPNSTISTSPVSTLRRLVVYLGIMSFRTGVLYLIFNRIEHWLVHASPESPSDCWYNHLLHDGQPECRGRAFDFSDHIVLYFAQILPVALAEVLYAIEYAYWKPAKSSASAGGNRKASAAAGTATSSSWCIRSCLDAAFRHFIPFVLVSGLLYLYWITLRGVYKTSAFFHTGEEVLTGYLVSMLVQVPLCYVQCFGAFGGGRRGGGSASAGTSKDAVISIASGSGRGGLSSAVTGTVSFKEIQKLDSLVKSSCARPYAVPE